MLHSDMIGRFRGTGRWYDSAGKTQAYTIEQTTSPVADGFELAFEHVFEDATVIRATFHLIPIGPPLFRLDIAGAAAGHGYCIDEHCHYHLRAGEAFVEASYIRTEGGLRVFGSSSRNAEGNYVAWTEQLLRVEG